MGYQGSAFGILLNRNKDVGFFDIVCKKVIVWNSDKTQSKTFEGEEKYKIFELWEDSPEDDDTTYEDWTAEYEWYDNVKPKEEPPVDVGNEDFSAEFEDISFYFINYPNVTIGKTCVCLSMIYIAELYDEKSKTVCPDSLSDLLKVREELIEQGRLEEDKQLGLFSNCCS